MTENLQGRKGYKIVLGTSVEEYGVLLKLKERLGDLFYVRNIDNKLDGGFTVAFGEEGFERLDDGLKSRVQRMLDEGVSRFCVPFLYRFLPDEFIDDFVCGKIRLSTFNRCKRLENENRADGREGTVEFFYGDRKVASAAVGKNGYLLCASLTPFASGSVPNGRCIIIREAQEFVNSITAALRKKGVKVSAVVQGPCVYTDHRVALSEDPEHSPEELKALLDDFGDRVYMLKDALPHFMVEHEYRIIWLTDGAIEVDSVDIQIEHPEQYIQVMKVPPYVQMFRPPTVAARNHPYVMPPQAIEKNARGTVKVV